MKVLGIDPGLANTGWAVLEPLANGKFRLIDTGTIKTDGKDKFSVRLSFIVRNILDIIQKHSVKLISAEEIFFTRNISSGIEVAKVIGAIIYALSEKNLPVNLFTPTKIKQTVTGGGKADKKAIHFMVSQQLEKNLAIKNEHQADAIAVGITLIREIQAQLLTSE